LHVFNFVAEKLVVFADFKTIGLQIYVVSYDVTGQATRYSFALNSVILVVCRLCDEHPFVRLSRPI